MKNIDIDDALAAFPYEDEHQNIEACEEHGDVFVTCLDCGAQACEEHGGVFVTCLDCGAQWSANETTAPHAFDYEEVSAGDKSCGISQECEGCTAIIVRSDDESKLCASCAGNDADDEESGA